MSSLSPCCCTVYMRQARKLETEVDVRLAAFGKLCAGLDTTYGSDRGETGLAGNQVSMQSLYYYSLADPLWGLG